jgi:hypothetical protein
MDFCGVGHEAVWTVVDWSRAVEAHYCTTSIYPTHIRHSYLRPHGRGLQPNSTIAGCTDERTLISNIVLCGVQTLCITKAKGREGVEETILIRSSTGYNNGKKRS